MSACNCCPTKPTHNFYFVARSKSGVASKCGVIATEMDPIIGPDARTFYYQKVFKTYTVSESEGFITTYAVGPSGGCTASSTNPNWVMPKVQSSVRKASLSNEDTSEDVLARASADYAAAEYGEWTSKGEQFTSCKLWDTFNIATNRLHQEINLEGSEWYYMATLPITCYLKVWVEERFIPPTFGEIASSVFEIVIDGKGSPTGRCDSVFQGENNTSDPVAGLSISDIGSTELRVLKFSHLPGYTPADPILHQYGWYSRPCPDTRPSGVPDPLSKRGCVDFCAGNYDPLATCQEDGDCDYSSYNPLCGGCTNSCDSNWGGPSLVFDDGSCNGDNRNCMEWY